MRHISCVPLPWLDAVTGMVVAVVCARGGSKGVPDKNRWLLGGTPLIARAIKTAQEAKIFDLVVASSDSDQLLSLAFEAGVDLAVHRPESLASDTASKLDAIRHAVSAAETHSGRKSRIVVDLDVTTPLRVAQDIIDTVAVLEDPDVDRVFTATPARRSPYFNQAELDTDGSPSIPCGPGTLVRRQDAPPVYDLSGAVYAWRRGALFGAGPLLQRGARLHVIPPDRAWDIDGDLDLLVVEALAQRSGP